MGALMRATLNEVEELVAGDPLWWPSLCAKVAEGGAVVLKQEKEERGWAANAIWLWITRDVGRYGEYKAALEYFAACRVHGTAAVVDAGPAPGEDVARDRLRMEQAFKQAEYVSPKAGSGGGVKVVLVNFVQAEDGRVVEAEGGLISEDTDTARVAVSGKSGGAVPQLQTGKGD